ncbi:hypothetical protein HDU80_010077 [Chytriomyces hyalinus]|nr:hypothetical protein HDU80_010077 [Chytriomyces hyalinus]
MSPRIADPSRHEKVLSFLHGEALTASADPTAAITAIDGCMSSTDERLHSLAIRFAGVLISLGCDANGNSIFASFQKLSPLTLTLLINWAKSRETPSPLRFGCIEALAGFCKAVDAVDWLIEEDVISEIVWNAFADESIYVSTALTSLLKAFITAPKPTSTIDSGTTIGHHILLSTLTVKGNLYQILESSLLGLDWRMYCCDATKDDSTAKGSKNSMPHHRIDKQLLVLTLVWELLQTRDLADRNSAFRFLKESGLILATMRMFPVEKDRFVMSRISDVLKALFRAEPSLLSQFFPGTKLLTEQDCKPGGYSVRCLYEFLAMPILVEDGASSDFTRLVKVVGALRIGTCIFSGENDIRSESNSCPIDGALVKWYLKLVLDVAGVVLEYLKPKPAMGPINSVNILHNPASIFEWKNADLNAAIGWTEGVATFSDSLTKLICKSFLACPDTKDPYPPRVADGAAMDILHDLCNSLGQILPACKNLLHFKEEEAVFNFLDCISRNERLQRTHRIFQGNLTNTLLFVTLTNKSNDKFLVEKIPATILFILQNVDTRPFYVKLALKLVSSSFRFPSWPKSASMPAISEAIESRFYDMQWDVKTMVIDFVKELFQPGNPECTACFGLQFVKPLMNRCNDAEPNVRYAALTCIQTLVEHAVSWKYIKAQNLESFLISELLSKHMQDSEALVRRSAVDLVTALMPRASSINLLLNDSQDSDDKKIGRVKLKHLVIEDSDSEVRLRALRLLSVLFEVTCFGSSDFNRNWFFNVNGDGLILEATKDSSRIVRSESATIVVKMISVGASIYDGSKKRPRASIESPLATFLDQLGAIDVDALVEGSKAEHLYEEALEVNKSLIQEGDELNEGNNVLTCYDC